jgi:hypothetical protein
MPGTRRQRTLSALWALLCVCLTLDAAAQSAAPAPAPNAPNAPPKKPARVHKESPALFGMGAQACKAFIDVAGETSNREIAISGAMFSWAQGWFSARNVIGHESAPRVVGGTLSAEKLKAMLVEECRAHQDESLYLAVDDLYDQLARKGL